MIYYYKYGKTAVQSSVLVRLSALGVDRFGGPPICYNRNAGFPAENIIQLVKVYKTVVLGLR